MNPGPRSKICKNPTWCNLSLCFTPFTIFSIFTKMLRHHFKPTQALFLKLYQALVLFRTPLYSCHKINIPFFHIRTAHYAQTLMVHTFTAQRSHFSRSRLQHSIYLLCDSRISTNRFCLFLVHWLLHGIYYLICFAFINLSVLVLLYYMTMPLIQTRWLKQSINEFADAFCPDNKYPGQQK